MKRFAITSTAGFSAAIAASPAAAAEGAFLSLANSDFVVLLAFLVFLAILFYANVPSKIGALLDKRAATIQAELEEARSLREEAQALLASYERKQKDVQAQADRIVTSAREEAAAAAEQAKLDLQNSIARRLAGAEEQIAQAEASAVRQVRDRAVTVAIAAARDVITREMTAQQSNKLIDDAISDVQAKLH